MVGDAQIVINGLGNTDDLYVQADLLKIGGQLLDGIHGVIAADVEKRPDFAAFQHCGNLFIVAAVLVIIRQLIAAGAEDGRRGLAQQFHVFVGADHGFQINEVILDNALDTVHRAKNGIDCRFFEGFPEHAHQRSVYGTGRTAGLSNSNIHRKISFFCGKSHCIPENILKWRSFLLYPIFVALSTFYRKFAESVAVGQPVVQRK